MRPECPVQDQVSTTTTLGHRAQYVNTYCKSEEDNARWTTAWLMKIGGAALITHRPVASIGT
jgi:hypothetical protein